MNRLIAAATALANGASHVRSRPSIAPHTSVEAAGTQVAADSAQSSDASSGIDGYQGVSTYLNDARYRVMPNHVVGVLLSMPGLLLCRHPA